MTIYFEFLVPLLVIIWICVSIVFFFKVMQRLFGVSTRLDHKNWEARLNLERFNRTFSLGDLMVKASVDNPDLRGCPRQSARFSVLFINENRENVCSAPFCPTTTIFVTETNWHANHVRRDGPSAAAAATKMPC